MAKPRNPDLPADATGFRPVRTRKRHDGCTPEKQHDFIREPVESGCVTEAAAATGMTRRIACTLRARAHPRPFVSCDGPFSNPRVRTL